MQKIAFMPDIPDFSEDLIGFVHSHFYFEKRIKNKTFVNPGSLGCDEKSKARFVIIEFHRGKFTIITHILGYDDAELFKKFEERNVPYRKFIYKTFFGGRFKTKRERKDRN